MVNPGFVGFDWDDGNRSKCQKHGMTIAQIEHVVPHHSTLLVPSPKGSGEARYHRDWPDTGRPACHGRVHAMDEAR